MSKQKSKQNRILLVERSCAKVSGPSEVPRFVRELIVRKPIESQAGVRVLDTQVLARPLSKCKRKLVRNTYNAFREIVKSLYSWIANQRDAHKKSISQATRRVTTIPRPPLESSRQGEFRSEWSIFV